MLGRVRVAKLGYDEGEAHQNYKCQVEGCIGWSQVTTNSMTLQIKCYGKN